MCVSHSTAEKPKLCRKTHPPVGILPTFWLYIAEKLQNPVSKPETLQRRLAPLWKVAPDGKSWLLISEAKPPRYSILKAIRLEALPLTKKGGDSDYQMTTWAPSMLISSRNTLIYKLRIIFDQVLEHLVAYSRWHTKITHQRRGRFNQQVSTKLEWETKFRFPISSTSGHGDVGSVTLVLGRRESVRLIG